MGISASCQLLAVTLIEPGSLKQRAVDGITMLKRCNSIIMYY
jgi:hypothetical protein